MKIVISNRLSKFPQDWRLVPLQVIRFDLGDSRSASPNARQMLFGAFQPLFAMPDLVQQNDRRLKRFHVSEHYISNRLHIRIV